MTRNYFVALYLEELGYGGPEEGGWWYDRGERERERPVFLFRTKEKAYDFMYRWNRRLDRWINAKRYPKSSVLSTGIYVARVCEDELEDNYPSHRPHYE